MRMLTQLLFGESGTHTGEQCQLLLTPCYFVPALTLLIYSVDCSRSIGGLPEIRNGSEGNLIRIHSNVNS